MEYIKNKLDLPESVIIFDTTLRDGEQMPGVALKKEDKLRVAKQLDKVGVDVIEAGFPITSKGEMSAVKDIANEGLNAKICALARALKKDIDVALSCEVDWIHTFIGTSELHLKYKLKKTQDDAVEMAVSAVEYAKEHGVKVEFSAEDATRTDIDFLKRIYSATVDAGADKINVPDTVGVIAPVAMRYLIKELKKDVKVPISVHCHNDFGQAVANSVAAVEGGAKQVHVTVNGLGERAGNAALESVVTSLYALYGVKTNIQMKYLVETSRFVSRVTGIPVLPNTPIVGANAFAHESGIHAHGVLVRAATYEPITPEMVGHRRELVIGKHTGMHSIKAKLEAWGIPVNDEQLAEITNRVKELGDLGKKITDSDLEVIAEAVIGKVAKESRVAQLKQLTVVTGTNVTPTASVKIKLKDREIIKAETGVGPVDAAINAIRAISKEFGNIELIEYRIEAVTGGTDAIAEVIIKVRDEDGNIYTTRAASADIVHASVEALMEGINMAFLKRSQKR